MILITGARLGSDSKSIAFTYRAPRGVVRAIERGTLQPWVRGFGTHSAEIHVFGDGPGRRWEGRYEIMKGPFARGGFIPVRYSELTGSGRIQVPWTPDPGGGGISLGHVEAGLQTPQGTRIGRVTQQKMRLWLEPGPE